MHDPGEADIVGDPRTSLSHPLRIAEIRVRQGLLGLTICPGKKAASVFGPRWDRDLAIDLSVIQGWGAALMITLMEQHELDAVGVPNLGHAAEAHGIEWWHLPIRDLYAPDGRFRGLWKAGGPQVIARLDAGEHILIHCRGGLGRTGVVAAQILIESGMSIEQAITFVRNVRPGAIETRSQETYLEQLSVC